MMCPSVGSWVYAKENFSWQLLHTMLQTGEMRLANLQQISSRVFITKSLTLM